MKLVPILAAANAVLAVASALLGAAPFTPAPILFFVLLPLAAFFARHNHTVAALLVVVAAAAAVFLSPIQFSQLPAAFLLVSGTWVSLWCAAVIYFSRHKLQAVITAVRGGGVHGA